MSGPAIEIRDVTFYYNSYPILLNVNLEVADRDFLALIGRKTTLLKVVLGILRPQKGSVKIFGPPPPRPPDLWDMFPRTPGSTRISRFRSWM